MFTCVNILHRLKPLLGTKLGFFLVRSSFLPARASHLVETFRNDYVAACGTALRRATEVIESGGYVTVPCSSKMTQCSSKADWLKFQWRHQIGCDGTHTEQIFTFKVTLIKNSCICYCHLVDTVNLDLNSCTSQLKRWIYILLVILVLKIAPKNNIMKTQ